MTQNPLQKIERERKEAIKIENNIAKNILKQFNNKNVYDEEGFPIPKIFYKKQKGKMSGILTIRCGDCKEKVKICNNVLNNASLEINGVLASKGIWRKILLPLFKKKKILFSKEKKY